MPIRKIYVDSARSQGSGSDFSYQCAQSISCPLNTKAVIDEVIVPNTFYTVDSTRCHLYMREYAVGDGTSVTDVRATIANGSYSGVDLATAVQTALNNSKNWGTSYTVTYHIHKGTLSIYNPTQGYFGIMLREQLIALGSWAGVPFGKEPNDANAVIGFDATGTYGGGAMTMTKMVQLMPAQNAYLCSSDFGLPNQALGPNGETHILRKICVDQSWGNLLRGQHSTELDYIDVSGQQLESLSFSVRDSRGNLLDLHGHHISFTIILILPVEI